jgi:UDP-glucose 4-epimerase
VVQALRSSTAFESVRCVDAPARIRDSDGDGDDVDLVSFVPDHRPFVDYLEKEGTDTVIQCGLVADRSGLGARASEADVIATMCLGAVIGHKGSSVRSWVLASSTDVYGIGRHSALLQDEEQELPREEETLAASIAEAEDYARDIANRLPHVNVAILRLQQLVGQGVRGPLASLLASRFVPTPIGYEPTIQLLHLDDAASAMFYAAKTELAGIYNVASADLIHWDAAVRATGHNRFPVLPINVALFEPVLKRLGVPFVPAELTDLLTYGHAVDTRKIERAGWQPEYGQQGCLSLLRDD